MSNPRRRLLIVHDDGAVRLSLIRTFESAGWGTQGVRTQLGAEAWLDEGNDVSAILLSWELPDQGAPLLLLSLNNRATDERPAILAYSPKWTMEDLQRAVQLGADGVLRSPLTVDSVALDLDSMEKTGEARSRRILLDQAADALLQPVEFIIDDDAERAEQTKIWRDQMKSMAGTLRAFLRRLRGLDSDDDPVDVAWLRTLVDTMREAEGADLTRLRALIQSDAWNDQIDEVTRRRLMAMFNRRNDAELRVDLERLRTLFGPELKNQNFDLERLRGLLDKPAALAAFDDDTRERMKNLRGRDWRMVVDYVKLEDLKARFGRKAGSDAVDKDRLRGLLRTDDAVEEVGLSPEEQMKLQLTMAMMFRVRNDDDRGKLVDRLRKSHGESGKTAVKLKDMLSEMKEDRTLGLLRNKLGFSAEGAQPAEVAKLLGKNDLEPAIFGVADLPDDHPQSVPLLNEIGMRLKRAKRWEEAAEHYERALEIMPKESGLLFNYARLKFDLGEVDAAERLVKRMDRGMLEETPVKTLLYAIDRTRAQQKADAEGG